MEELEGEGMCARNEHIGLATRWPFNYIPPVPRHFSLIVTVSISLFKTKGQRLTVYMEEMWEGYCHCPNFSFKIIRHQNMYPHITHTHNTPMQSHDFKRRKWRKETDKVSESVVAFVQSYGSKNVRSGRVCVFVTCDPRMLLQGVDNLDTISDREKLRNACIGCCAQKRQNMWPGDNVWHSNHIPIRDPMAWC
jgi:hypothetical protein